MNTRTTPVYLTQTEGIPSSAWKTGQVVEIKSAGDTNQLHPEVINYSYSYIWYVLGEPEYPEETENLRTDTELRIKPMTLEPWSHNAKRCTTLQPGKTDIIPSSTTPTPTPQK